MFFQFSHCLDASLAQSTDYSTALHEFFMLEVSNIMLVKLYHCTKDPPW